MAETGKKATEAVVPSNPAPDIARRGDELPPTPKESEDAELKVSTVWPDGSFTVEDVPVITVDGTMLTKPQFEKAEKAAEESGVRLTVEDVK